ncbi:ATP-dependent zinc metalloprotease FTSH 10 [Hibiscus syriacus]|uniref:ATP-dependent zinc metalloprotease FTSH 10 n=1 Tax=Hibiscus syriacus TaxID=106335 RepID=A0A6A2WXL4_HIBSY|nr:cyclin-dependent protein kinase inhibitor SMR5-like [Hibiscus syriacus]KAE8666703.1 ATP-dependent zinc metalloprotease FTSH 10 [Hibiscus syriacus]
MEGKMESYEDVMKSMATLIQEEQDRGSTPTRRECRIPAVKVCPPPPPRKKPFTFAKKSVEPPKNGYFQPPDLEMVFSMGSRRQAISLVAK